jgi:hypothetical protein
MKVLELGTVLLFGGLAAYTVIVNAVWSIPAVRLWVDGGLLLVVLVSIAVRQPFTLQYAREQVSPGLWNTPEFVRTNYIITAVWAAAFALMVGADLMMLYIPSLRAFMAVVVTILAIWGAARFTAWYPKRAKRETSRKMQPRKPRIHS